MRAVLRLRAAGEENLTDFVIRTSARQAQGDQSLPARRIQHQEPPAAVAIDVERPSRDVAVAGQIGDQLPAAQGHLKGGGAPEGDRDPGPRSPGWAGPLSRPKPRHEERVRAQPAR